MTVSESHKKDLESAESIITYTISDDKDEGILFKIEPELKQYLESEKYYVVVKSGLVTTNAKLLPDKN